MARDRSEYDKKYYETHKLQARAASKKWEAENASKLKEYRQAWREKNKEKINENRRKTRKPGAGRAYSLKKRYGLSTEGYEALFHQQRGLCAICLLPPASGEFLAVDHNHSTGVVRGLLHRHCNRAIGLLGDCSENLQRAADYLNV